MKARGVTIARGVALALAASACVGTRDTYLAEMAVEYCDWIARC